MERHKKFFIAECILYPVLIAISICMCAYNPKKPANLPSNLPSLDTYDKKSIFDKPLDNRPAYNPLEISTNTSNLVSISSSQHN